MVPAVPLCCSCCKSLEDIRINVLSELLLQPELTASSFPIYYSMKKPFVILFHKVTDSPLHDMLGSVAKESKFPEVILAWMNA